MKNKKHTPLLAALATLVVLLAGVVLIWLAKVRPMWARAAVRSSPTSCGLSFCRTARLQRRSLPTTRIF